MKFLLPILLATGCWLLVFISPASAAPPSTSKWQLVFSDEFDGTRLDSSKWVPCHWWGTPQGCLSGTTPNMTYQPDNVILDNGILKLRTRQGAFTGIDGKTYPYSSGMVSTSGFYKEDASAHRFTFKYGYAEARIKVPKGKGLWPAFWMLTPQKNLPEIDIMEILTGNGNTTFRHHMVFHYQGGKSGTHFDAPVDLANDFHTYAVWWSPAAIRWYLDDVEVRPQFTNTSVIPDERMYLIVNLQVGGNWPGEPDDTTPFPSTMEVDWVRVWQLSGDSE